MGLSRVILWGMLVATLWLLPGCGGDSVSSPSVWGGSQTVTDDSAELQDVYWDSLPGWKEWAALPKKSRIQIHGKWKMTGSGEPVEFQCRLSRQSGSLYKISFQTLNAGCAAGAAGDLDLGRRSAALDIQGIFTPEQFRACFKIRPVLKNGTVRVRGSSLLVDDTVSFPMLTLIPGRESVLQLGSFPLTGGRLERRETFSGKVEFSFYGMKIQAGSMTLRPREGSADDRQAVFKGSVEPNQPWQNSLPLQGEGRTSLLEDGKWSILADLPEPGVFQQDKLILPLRTCRIVGEGDPAGGIWKFSGEGASCSYLDPAGTVTGSAIRFNGSRQFQFGRRSSTPFPDLAHLEIGRLDMPFRDGRIILTGIRSDIQKMSTPGCTAFTGRADEVIFRRKKEGEFRIVEPEWHLPLLLVGGRWISPEPGTVRAKSVRLVNPGWQAALLDIVSSFTMKEHSWEMSLKKGNLSAASGKKSAGMDFTGMKISGPRTGNAWVDISGNGDRGDWKTTVSSGRCGSWDLHVGLSADLARCGWVTWQGRDLQGAFGVKGALRVARLVVRAERKSGQVWKGRIDLEGGNGEAPGFSVANVAMQLPFGGEDAAGCTVKAAELRHRKTVLSGLALELQNSADGLSLKGRGRMALTGGACFVTGDIRSDLLQGSLEYAMPAATLQKEQPVSGFLPLAGGWNFSGKVGENGKIRWNGALPLWQRKFVFSGFARSEACMVEEISGEIEPENGEIRRGQLLFRRLTALNGEYTNGDLQFRTEKGRTILLDGRFDGWGGHWKHVKNMDFQVKGMDVTGLLPLEAWQNAVKGKFSGKVTLDDTWAICCGELKSDAAGTLALSAMEKYRLLPRREFDMNALAFTTAAFRDFQFNTLSLRLVGRKNALFLRISGDGRPAKAVPFVLEKSGFFRPAVSGERGFDGNVEIGCGYRIPRRDLPKSSADPGQKK